MRDVAKRAVELGDKAVIMQLLAEADPDKPTQFGSETSVSALMAAAEKAYSAGDFPKAMQGYTAAAAADPKLYEAPLFAGDTAYAQKDLKTAAKWLARAIAVDPNRETAYRYWGDAILRFGDDPDGAKEKFIDAVVAEPYSKLAWQGIQQWAQRENAVLLPPQIHRPAPPVRDPKKPNNISIQVDPESIDDKKHPGGAAWMMYSLTRASWNGDEFRKQFPEEKEYRHTLKEEDAALSMVAQSVKEQNIKADNLDEGLRNLLELKDAGMLDCWILIQGADNGIARDYDAYRREHSSLLHQYLERFVVHARTWTDSSGRK
jgi:tetratricopeptide (TPR) repeat protein